MAHGFGRAPAAFLRPVGRHTPTESRQAMANDGRPRHADGTTDERYRIMPEWCGEATRQLVVRFCGDWVGHAATMADAYAIAQVHADERRAAVARIAQPDA